MRKRVLLIEDEPNIIQAISFILSRDGWTVDTHADGSTAIAEVARRSPDIVILDVMLPNRSGFDILQDFIYEGVRGSLKGDASTLDVFQLQDADPAQRRYG